MGITGFLVLAVLTTTVLCHVTVPTSHDYCAMDIFNASCGPGEVVMMHSAQYGRMKRGKCVKKDLGFLGCSANVLQIMDAACSGRNNCSFSVPSQALYNTKPCPEDTMSYLEASYRCVRVTQWSGPPPRCRDRVLLTAPSGYISSSLTSLWSLGTSRCPWRISVAPGQKILITSFNLLGSGRENFKSAGCYQYAALLENNVLVKEVTLCGGERRETKLYTSSSHVLDVQVVEAQVLKNLGPLLLKYQALGCPNLPDPQGGQVTRRGENATLTCDNGNDVWYLTCKGTEWLGPMSNCSHGGSTGPVLGASASFPMGILLVVAIGVALGVFLGGLLLAGAVFYMRRRHRGYVQQPVPRHCYPDQKSVTIVPTHHSDVWEPAPKCLDVEDGLLRTVPSSACRMCALPSSGGQEIIPLGPPPQSRHNAPQSDRCHNVTGPAEFPSPPDLTSRHHIYECPKFS